MCSFPRLNGSLLGSLLRACGSAEEAEGCAVTAALLSKLVCPKAWRQFWHHSCVPGIWYVPKPGNSFGIAAVYLGFVVLTCGLNSEYTVALGLSHGVDNASFHSVLLR